MSYGDMSHNNVRGAMIRNLYRVALCLYPRDFRVHFARQMCSAFELGLAGGRMRGVSEIGGLFAGAAREWFAKITTDPLVRARTLPDWRFMRPAGISKEVWFGGPLQTASWQSACSRDTTP